MKKLIKDVSPYLVVVLLVLLAGGAFYVYGSREQYRMEQYCTVHWRDFASDSVEDYAEFRKNPTVPELNRMQRAIRQNGFKPEESAPK